MPEHLPERGARYLGLPDELPGRTQGHHREADQQDGVLQTGWFDNSAVLDGWAEDDDDFKIRQRYQFTLRNDVRVTPSRCRYGCWITEETIDGETSTVLTPADAQRYATAPEPVFPLLRQAAQGP